MKRLKFGLLLMAVFFSLAIPYHSVQAQAEPPFHIYLPAVNNKGINNLVSPPANCDSAANQWLCLLNQYRAAAGLAAVSEDPQDNSALQKHTRYLLLNPGQENLHTEYSQNPGYSEEGKEAGAQSNMAWKASTDFSVQETMELWMRFVGHRYNMLHPDLQSSGFDLNCDAQNCTSGLNILSGLPYSYQISTTNVIYPGENQRGIPAEIFPVTWAFFMPWTGNESDQDEVVLLSGEIYDQQNQKIALTRSEPNHQDGIWEYKNQIILTPQAALKSGQTYRVELSVRFHGQVYQRNWSFSTR